MTNEEIDTITETLNKSLKEKLRTSEALKKSLEEDKKSNQDLRDIKEIIRNINFE